MTILDKENLSNLFRIVYQNFDRVQLSTLYSEDNLDKNLPKCYLAERKQKDVLTDRLFNGGHISYDISAFFKLKQFKKGEKLTPKERYEKYSRLLTLEDMEKGIENFQKDFPQDFKDFEENNISKELALNILTYMAFGKKLLN